MAGPVLSVRCAVIAVAAAEPDVIVWLEQNGAFPGTAVQLVAWRGRRETSRPLPKGCPHSSLCHSSVGRAWVTFPQDSHSGPSC